MLGHISKSNVNDLRPGQLLADDEIKGFVARCLPSGAITYGLRYSVNGQQRWLGLGLHGRITPDQARKLAQQRAGEVAADRDPAAERKIERARAEHAKANTVNAMLDSFIADHVKKTLRTAYEVERVLNRCVRPRIGNMCIYDVRRSDVMKMLKGYRRRKRSRYGRSGPGAHTQGVQLEGAVRR